QSALDAVVAQQIHSDPKLAEIGWLKNTVPTIPTGMAADYRTLTRSYFNANGGDIKSAEASASRDLSASWGLTRMNGSPELVRYPPERLFPGLKADDIRADLARTVEKSPEAFTRWNPGDRKLETFHVEPSALQLVPTDDTDRTGGREWGLRYADPQTGVSESLFGKDGQPLSYELPLTQQAYSSVRAHQKEQRVKEQEAEYQRREAALKAERDVLARDEAMGVDIPGMPPQTSGQEFQ
ncbi:MAG TPA: hypothetical protein VH137_01950, partial [Gemmatimonadales bacterium]|nr:hypothetical protein [Gemmatimonadales bacterium]